MTIRQKSAFRLETTWKPAAAAENLVYSLTLTNLSAKPVEGFRLCVSGPARIDPGAQVEGGTLVARLSNHAEFAPPDGFVLEPNGSWTVTAHGLSYDLRHWTDGANTAYLAFADGTTAAVAVAPTRAVGDNATLKRGAEIYPVPDQAPVPVSIVPWPQSVAVSGRLAVPPGLDLSANGGERRGSGRELCRACRQPVSRRRHRAPGGRGRISGLRLARQGVRPRGLCDQPFRRQVRRSPAALAPACSTD